MLAGHEAHHLIHVMRAKPGDRVVLFDGSGAEFTARLERVGRTTAELSILSRDEVDRELPVQLTVGAALPKGDRGKWLVEKAVELGVRRLVPLLTARSVARAGPKALSRLRRTVIEASKQCGRNRLMEITPPQVWPDFVAATQSAPCRLLAHPGGQASERLHSELSQSTAIREGPPLPDREGTSACCFPESLSLRRFDAAVLAVGPEGGFTSDEVALAAAAGWRLVDLGPRILRIETAAILLIAMVGRS